MILGGLIPNSLIDFPGKPAVVVFTQGCNWCCPYCHNANLIPHRRFANISVDDPFRILGRRPVGARNLVVTGGEPTLQSGLVRFLKEAACVGAQVKLDTNGSNPVVLKQVLDLGLVDYVAVDIKGPLENYARFCGQIVLPEVLEESISLLLQSGVDHEFRTTVVPALHQVDDFKHIGPRIAGGKRLFLQAFCPEHALRLRLAKTPVPTPDFLEACAHVVEHWITTFIRK